ncbi:MAG: TonB-dependent receptor plug domain-containing protein [Butyricimonas faecihominis]
MVNVIKRELIGSVSSVKAKDLEEVPSASLQNLLQGHMAGVEVSNISGAPAVGVPE